MMKKLFSLSLALLMTLSLAACGEKPTEAPVEEQPPAPPQLSFCVEESDWSAVETLEHEGETYTLVSGYAKLPKLLLVDESGAEQQPQGDAYHELLQSKALENFNAAMEERLKKLQEAYEKDIEDAKVMFPQVMASEYGFWAPMAEEIHSYVYENGDLLSVTLVGYCYLGGAHPTNYYETYNFDLASGEFVDYTDLAASEEDFRMAVAEYIRSYIYASGLNEGYYDDFESYLFDLAYTHMAFDEQGMTVFFEEYTMGPHAAGIPTFLVPYDVFCDYLNDYGRALLAVPQESFVLADHRAAVELWGYFHRTTLPLDYKTSIEDGGYTYHPVQGIATMAELREVLTERVSEELAEEWLNGSELRYREINGVLCGMDADRGSTLELGSTTYSVEFAPAGGGKVIGTTKVYDTNQWDRVEKDFVVVDSMTTEYPFDWVEGEAIFTAFPYPY